MLSEHYAEAFVAQPGRCWRMVYESAGTGRPVHCPEPVAWRGRYRTPRGKKWFTVESCEGHVDEQLVSLRAIPAGTYHRADDDPVSLHEAGDEPR